MGHYIGKDMFRYVNRTFQGRRGFLKSEHVFENRAGETRLI